MGIYIRYKEIKTECDSSEGFESNKRNEAMKCKKRNRYRRAGIGCISISKARTL